MVVSGGNIAADNWVRTVWSATITLGISAVPVPTIPYILFNHLAHRSPSIHVNTTSLCPTFSPSLHCFPIDLKAGMTFCRFFSDTATITTRGAEMCLGFITDWNVSESSCNTEGSRFLPGTVQQLAAFGGDPKSYLNNQSLMSSTL